ncbi:hypothetical protein COO60DRAFT_119403 [Scenedesmus sp. NREL 46B-D3]|nr:hypothetical protein COO60DRAFT_119403 [Scenedesmus sp. NREL 46B-D3]
MQYRRLDGAEANSLTQLISRRMGRPMLLYVVGLIVIGAIVLKAWGSTAAGDVRAAAAAAGAAEQSLQQQPTSTVQGIPLPEYKSYWVGNSTIPGAGLGVFARTDMPAGTVWNLEDAEPDNTIAITLRQWQALTGLEEHLQQAGRVHASPRGHAMRGCCGGAAAAAAALQPLHCAFCALL